MKTKIFLKSKVCFDSRGSASFEYGLILNFLQNKPNKCFISMISSCFFGKWWSSFHQMLSISPFLNPNQ